MRRVPVVLLVCLVACVGPARTFGVYESRASNSVEGALSAVDTTRLAIRDALAGDAQAAFVSITIQDAEETASTAEGHFASIQPPDERSDRLRRLVGDLLSRSDDLIARARIAARRQDTTTMSNLVGPLRRLSDRLDGFLGAHG
ncbi:MAG: hypothetical protein ABR600_04040 [Actinomycetota bacterium]